jgi:hypothetical protein
MVAATLLTLAACGGTEPLVAGVGQCPESSEAESGRGPDEAFLEVSQRVDAFGGMYLDDESIVIWTTDGAQATAQEALGELVKALGDESLASLTPRVRQADYRFTQLKTWHECVRREVGGIDGVVSNDIDDRTNRILIGVEDLDAHTPAVIAELARLGVPREAVTIEEVPPVQQE